MNKAQRIEYQKSLEAYLESNNVYEIFEKMLVNLMKDMPDNPLEYMTQKLGQPEPIRVLIMGPPGSNKKEVALSLAEHFDIRNCLSIGDLLRKEISKKSDLGRRIAEARKSYSYVDDEIAIELMEKNISELEKTGQSWIMEGFPRTRVQALALQKLGIIPDKFILLNVEDVTTLERVRFQLSKKDTENYANTSIENYNEDDIASIAKAALNEFSIHITDVKNVYKGFISQIDANKSKNQLIDDIARLLKIKIKSNAPRKPPRVMLFGMRGSGRKSQASKIADKFGLVYVSTSNLIKAEISKKEKLGQEISSYVLKGEMVPDEIVANLLEKRLRQTDCQVNGWILVGFPATENQITLFNSMKLAPSSIIVLEIDESIAYERIEGIRVDPTTGKIYNKSNMPGEDEILKRLIQAEGDKHEVVKKQVKQWEQFYPKLQDVYKDKLTCIPAEKPVEAITENIAVTIANPSH